MSDVEIDEGTIPVITGPPLNPQSYPSPLREVWQEVANAWAAGGIAPPVIYPGSDVLPCMACAVGVAVGPRQQEAMAAMAAVDIHAPVLCLLCTAALSGEDYTSITVPLGNPYRPVDE